MSVTTQIRRCTVADAEALALIGAATFLETFAGILAGQDIVAHCHRMHSANIYRGWLHDPAYALWLAECEPGRAPVGLTVVSPPQLPLPDTAGDLELKRIYLLGRFQGGGLGRRMLDAAVGHARAAGARRLLLGVFSGNERALGFYRRCGFAQIGTRKFDVGGTEYDDYIMALMLEQDD